MTKKQASDWAETHTRDLVRHVIDHYHTSLRHSVPELIPLAKRVESVHGNHSSCPRGLSPLLIEMWNELSLHMEKEEKVLFPLLCDGWKSPNDGGPVRQMLHEHEQHGQSLSEIRRVCQDFQLPEDACNSWKLLYKNLTNLESELLDHIQVENEVLFRRAIEP